MTIDDLLAEIIDRGATLHYLRQASPSIWEASIWRRLEQTTNGYVNAIGYGQSNISPNIALEYAIEALEKDPSLDTFEPALSAIDLPPAHIDIMSIVLGDQPAIFKRRQLT